MMFFNRDDIAMTYVIRKVSILFLLLLFAVGFAFQLPAQILLEQQTHNQLQASIDAEAEWMTEEITRISRSIYLKMSESLAMDYVEHGRDRDNIELNKVALTVELNSIIENESLVSALVYYSPSSKDESMLFAGRKNVETDVLYEEIKALIDYKYKETLTSYFCREIGGEQFIVFPYKVHNSFIAILIDTNEILSRLNQRLNIENTIYAVADRNGSILKSKGIDLVQIDMEQTGKYVRIDKKKYLQTVGNVNGVFVIGAFTPQAKVLSSLIFARIGLVFSLIIVMVIFNIAVSALKKYITKPVIEMVESMHSVGEGEAYALGECNTKIREYIVLHDSFNEMLEEVQKLKIEKYEEELLVQKANLQYLQLQVNPHFFLNTLNIIYSMAEVKDYETIQRLTLKFVEYLRYTFRPSATLVTLREELECVENYVEIQNIRFSGMIRYKNEIKKDYYQTLIPPFVLQSFVENSIKYAKKRRTKCVIAISAELFKERYLKITVRDNGDGYEEGYMEIINDGLFSETIDGKHIGIKNVGERLRLIFGNRAKIKLENNNGAVTNIYIPFS